MTQLLIQGAAILAQGPLVEAADEVRAPDLIVPKSVISGWKIVDVDLPSDFSLHGYTWGGNALVPVEPPPPTQQEYIVAVQSLLDSTAQQRGYDGILSACSYATSTNPKFGPEGKACSDWRDACWTYCYQALADVEGGKCAAPTVAGLIAELPAIAWPD